MAETNGRWKLSPMMGLTIAINLIGWGITIGTILTKLDALDQRVTKTENTNADQWRAIRPAEASERK